MPSYYKLQLPNLWLDFSNPSGIRTFFPKLLTQGYQDFELWWKCTIVILPCCRSTSNSFIPKAQGPCDTSTKYVLFYGWTVSKIYSIYKEHSVVHKKDTVCWHISPQSTMFQVWLVTKQVFQTHTLIRCITIDSTIQSTLRNQDLLLFPCFHELLQQYEEFPSTQGEHEWIRGRLQGEPNYNKRHSCLNWYSLILSKIEPH